jgi:cysteine-rich repeat protein
MTNHFCRITCLLLLLVTQTQGLDACVGGVADGVRHVDEECDDNNGLNGDGCNSLCKLEEPGYWLCTTVAEQTSVCCEKLVNPIDLSDVCTCVGITQPAIGEGYTITDRCDKRDIDECNHEDGGQCFATATCVNHLGQDGAQTHECVCPPGWHGDGTTICDLNTYVTEFSVVDRTVTTVDVNAVVVLLKSSNVIPASVTDVHAVSTLYYGDAGLNTTRRDLILAADVAPSRHLLGDGSTTGVEITFTMMSDTAAAMDILTAAINVTLLPPQYAVTLNPQSTVLISGRGAVNTMLGGFGVDSIDYDAAQGTWEIEARWEPDVQDTVASPFISRLGPSRTGVGPLSTFEVSKFPCLVPQPTVCCLDEYASEYVIGGFAHNITEQVGNCTLSSQIDSAGMFGTNSNPQIVQQLLTDYPRSSMESTSKGQFHMSLFMADVKDSFAQKIEFSDQHYELKFFVGMAYITLLPAPFIFSSVSQVQLTVNISPYLTFAFSSQQKYSFLKYLTMAVYQNKWIDSFLVTRNMQFVTAAIVLPPELTQNMDTGLIPLTSVRYAIARQMPSKTDTSLWTNPCYSGTGDGMYDQGKKWEDMYKSAAAQTCAMTKRLCMNPITASDLGLVEFNFPIGDGNITAAMQSADPAQNGYHLFITFEVSVIDTDGASIITEVFTEAPIRMTSVIKTCETLSKSLTLDTLTEVSMAVGLVGNTADWDTSMTTIHDAMSTTAYQNTPFVDAGEAHKSLASSLVTMVVKAKPTLELAFSGSTYYLQVDYLVSMHFLDDNKFTQVSDMMAAGTAYTADVNPTNKFMEIQFTPAATASCTLSNTATYSCGIRRGIIKGVSQPGACQDFANSTHGPDPVGPVKFIEDNLLGKNEFATALATNMTQLVRSKYEINDMLSRAWYINPGYTWPSAGGLSALYLTDKMIAVAAITLRDSVTDQTAGRRLLNIVTSPDGTTDITEVDVMSDSVAVPDVMSNSVAVQGRRLLTTAEEDAANLVTATQLLKDNPFRSQTPAIRFNVSIAETLLKIFEVPAGTPWTLVDFTINIDSTSTDIIKLTTDLLAVLNGSPKKFCPYCKKAYGAFALVLTIEEKQMARRALKQVGASPNKPYEGRLTFLLTFESGHSDDVIVIEGLKRLLTEESSTALAMSFSSYKIRESSFVGGVTIPPIKVKPHVNATDDSQDDLPLILGITIPVGVIALGVCFYFIYAAMNRDKEDNNDVENSSPLLHPTGSSMVANAGMRSVIIQEGSGGRMTTQKRGLKFY